MSASPLRRSTSVFALVTAIIALATLQAATTTYNTPTNISSIADGDTTVLVNGGSLTEPLLDFNNTGILEFDLTNPLTVTTRFTDFGTVVKKNTGTVTLDANNALFPAYGGAFAIEGGTLTIGQNSDGTAFGSATTLTFRNGGGTLASGYNAAISLTPAVVLDSTGQAASATFTNQGQAFFGVQGAISGTGSLALQSAGTGAVSGPNYATVEFAQSAAGTYSGVMSGTGGLVKTGSGALALSGSNSYGGTTTVSAGTLLLNGNQAAASGSLSVLAGATLGGTGTIGGNVSVAGTHSPGTSPGVQTIDGDLTYASGSAVTWELIDNTTGGSGQYDQVSLPTGNLAFSGATVLDMAFNSSGSLVDWENTFWAVDRNWLLYDLGSGTTSGLSNFTINSQNWQDANGLALGSSSRAGATFNLALVGQDVTLNYVAPVPEPRSLIFVAGGLAAVAGLRRRIARR